LEASPDLELYCDIENSTLNSLSFDWTNVMGNTGYNYSYTIDGGTPVTGSQIAPSHYTVIGLSPGHSVTFTIVSVNGSPCTEPQTVTCTTQQLGMDVFNGQSFHFSPNPVAHSLSISFTKPISDLKVFTLLGQEIMSLTPMSENIEVDMSHLVRGIYFVRILSDKVSKTIRIVKR
jgi:hypothetical protein